MTTKKRSYAARLGVLVVVLTLMSTCLLGGTMAKYTTEVTGTGSATVAKWSFKATESGKQTFTDIDLASTAYSNVGSGKIAPGTEGSFAIDLDARGSEVAVEYTIAFSGLKGKPAGLKFYSDADHNKEISLDSGKTGTIELAKVGGVVTETVYWAWPYEATGGADAVKAADVADVGDAGKSMTFNITVTGTQQTPAKTTV